MPARSWLDFAFQIPLVIWAAILESYTRCMEEACGDVCNTNSMASAIAVSSAVLFVPTLAPI